MYQLALIVFLFFVSFWPFSILERHIEQREFELNKISLETKFHLQKQILSVKERSREVVEDDRLKDWLSKSKNHSLTSLLSGKVKNPGQEFFAIVDFSDCNIIHNTSQILEMQSICQLNLVGPYQMHLISSSKANQWWHLQIFSIPRLKNQLHVVSGLIVSEQTLSKAINSKLDVTVSEMIPSEKSFFNLSEIDPSLRKLHLDSNDLVAKINSYVPILKAKTLSRIQNICFLIAIILTSLLLYRYRNSERKNIVANKEFSQFLRSEFGFNSNFNQPNPIRQWHAALEGFALQLETSKRIQKKELIQMRSKLQQSSVELDKLRIETATLRQFRNIKSQFSQLDEALQQFRKHFSSKQNWNALGPLNKAFEQAQNIASILDSWQSGIAERGERRYLRYLNEMKTEKGESYFNRDFAAIKLYCLTFLDATKKTQSELKDSAEHFHQVQNHSNIILGATSEKYSKELELDNEDLFESLLDVKSGNWEGKYELRNRTSRDFNMKISRNAIFPICSSIHRLAEYYGQEKHVELNLQFKFKKKKSGTNEEAYLVALLSRKTKSSSLDAQKQSKSTDQTLNEIEEVLNPVSIDLQILEFNQDQCIASFHWKTNEPIAPKRREGLREESERQQV